MLHVFIGFPDANQIIGDKYNAARWLESWKVMTSLCVYMFHMAMGAGCSCVGDLEFQNIYLRF